MIPKLKTFRIWSEISSNALLKANYMHLSQYKGKWGVNTHLDKITGTTSGKLKLEECKRCNGSSNDYKQSQHSAYRHQHHHHWHIVDDGQHYNNKMVMADWMLFMQLPLNERHKHKHNKTVDVVCESIGSGERIGSVYIIPSENANVLQTLYWRICVY